MVTCLVQGQATLHNHRPASLTSQESFFMLLVKQGSYGYHLTFKSYSLTHQRIEPRFAKYEADTVFHYRLHDAKDPLHCFELF